MLLDAPRHFRSSGVLVVRAYALHCVDVQLSHNCLQEALIFPAKKQLKTMLWRHSFLQTFSQNPPSDLWFSASLPPPKENTVKTAPCMRASAPRSDVSHAKRAQRPRCPQQKWTRSYQRPWNLGTLGHTFASKCWYQKIHPQNWSCFISIGFGVSTILAHTQGSLRR